jgi:hypothetical protein
MNYIISAILALAVGYILWQIKKERIALTYDLTESDNFPRDNGIGKYFVIKLRNSGNKAIENINLKVAFDSDIIETTSFSDETLLTDIERTGSVIKGNLPLLNPHEIFSITITTFSKSQISSPSFLARAIGVTALPKEDTSSINLSPLIVAVVAIAVTVFAAYMGWDTFIKTQSFKNVEVMETDNVHRPQGQPNSPQRIFSIFNRSGLSFLFSELIEKNGEVTYWKTGAFLMHKFLKDQRNRANYVSAMEKLIEIDEMHPSSLGFNLYLLAKMEQHQGNKERARKYLDECKKEAPLMYDYLMTQDSSYDTKSLELYFQKKN